MYVPTLVGIKSGSHERPDLIEDPRAGEQHAHQERGLHVNHERFLRAVAGGAEPRVVGDRVPEEHGHEFLAAERDAPLPAVGHDQRRDRLSARRGDG